MGWKYLVALLLTLFASGCNDYTPPTYRAYLVNRYAQALYVTVTDGGLATPVMYVLAADPSVAAATPTSVLGYIVSGDNHWAPARSRSGRWNARC